MTAAQLKLYPWQKQQWQQLQAYRVQQRIPQALLLTGKPGLGKRQLAEHYVAALLCADSELSDSGYACGVCSSCQLLAAHTHPDYLCLEPDEPGKAIGIDQIRQMNAKLALKPQFERYRVIIIEPADALNSAAANAFLKCLEEPTERTCFILIAQQASRLPATIRSRCQKMQCEPPDTQTALRWLAQQGVTVNSAIVLEMAQGSPLQALAYAKTEMIAVRQQVFEDWCQLASSDLRLQEIAERWQKFDQMQLDRVLSWLASWLSDLIKLGLAGQQATLRSPDLEPLLHKLLPQLDLKALYRYYDSILHSRSKLSTTLNKQLLIEALLLDWCQLNHR